MYMIVNRVYLLTLNEIPLKKLLLLMSGKKPCKMNMTLSSIMRHGFLWTFHLEPKKLATSWSTWQVQIIWITWQAWGEACGERFCIEGTHWLWWYFIPHKKWDRIHNILELATCNGCKFHQIDVKIAFYNGDFKRLSSCLNWKWSCSWSIVPFKLNLCYIG